MNIYYYIQLNNEKMFQYWDATSTSVSAKEFNVRKTEKIHYFWTKLRDKNDV